MQCSESVYVKGTSRMNIFIRFTEIFVFAKKYLYFVTTFVDQSIKYLTIKEAVINAQ